MLRVVSRGGGRGLGGLRNILSPNSSTLFEFVGVGFFMCITGILDEVLCHPPVPLHERQ